MPTQWKSPPADPGLPLDCVDVWKCRLDILDSQVTALFKLLSGEEHVRAERLKIPEKRNQFVITRGRLRQIIAGILDSDPRDFKFEYTSHGKPFLARNWQGHELVFNVSHSYKMAIIGVALDRQLGVDIEKIQEGKDHMGMANRFFSKREQTELSATPDADRTRAFYSCWTRKEAFVKAVGDGITYGLDTFAVSVRPDDERPSLDIHGNSTNEEPWSVFNIPMNDNYMASLAVSGAAVSIRYWV
jgi:4'-phosphopantetheinyl transferase